MIEQMLRDPKPYQAKEESENILGNRSVSLESKESCLCKYTNDKGRKREEKKIYELLTITKYRIKYNTRFKYVKMI